MKVDSIFDSETRVLMKRAYLMKVLNSASRSTRKNINSWINQFELHESPSRIGAVRLCTRNILSGHAERVVITRRI
jgi:hypothetical protein